MTRDEAMRLARQEYSRSIMEGMGLFMIGHGALTESYVLEQMALQIMEMDIGSDTMAATVHQLWGEARQIDGDMGHSGQQTGVRQ